MHFLYILRQPRIFFPLLPHLRHLRLIVSHRNIFMHVFVWLKRDSIDKFQWKLQIFFYFFLLVRYTSVLSVAEFSKVEKTGRKKSFAKSNVLHWITSFINRNCSATTILTVKMYIISSFHMGMSIFVHLLTALTNPVWVCTVYSVQCTPNTKSIEFESVRK